MRPKNLDDIDERLADIEDSLVDIGNELYTTKSSLGCVILLIIMAICLFTPVACGIAARV